ncbi:MAG: glycosyltransferase [Paludibacteraceae bacterium]|nr:glycosyltransferase [Paludibacteraceae bacterium]
MKKKINLLMLGTHDCKSGGHIMDVFSRLPEYYNAHVVTLYGLQGKKDYCFFDKNSLIYKIYVKAWYIILKLYLLLRFRIRFKTDETKREYCFFDNDLLSFPAKYILDKCPKGFIPDVISVHWVSNFISSKTLFDLHRMTGAKILINFVDEALLTGGCHYPVNCDKFYSDCADCPALKHGKKYSSIQLNHKKKYLKDLPLIVAGVPYDIRMAKQSPLFQHATFFPSVKFPNLGHVDKVDSKRKLGLSQDRFYVLVAASSLSDVRKGLGYSIEAVCAACKEIPNISVLVAGKPSDDLTSKFGQEDCRFLGFLDLADLITVMSASDCFLSTTLADSGPMMVNYSMNVGTPVVSFNVGVAQDLVLHKETGYIAEYRSVSDVKEGILYLYGLSAEERVLMSKRCLSNLMEKSSAGSVYENLPSILNF